MSLLNEQIPFQVRFHGNLKIDRVKFQRGRRAGPVMDV